MEISTSLVILLGSCLLLFFTGKWVVDSLKNLAQYLGWKEFVFAFFTISIGAVLPEFFIGITSAIRGIPELSLGNIVGQNIILFSLTLAVAVFTLNKLYVKSQTVKTGVTFASIAAILPLILILDGELSRSDGVILILCFFFFINWLFYKKERFVKIYGEDEKIIKNRGVFSIFKDISLATVGICLVVLSAQGIVYSSLSLSDSFGISLPIIGIVLIALGTGLPETYFVYLLAKDGQNWMIMGGIFGAVIISSTLVLGVVSLIHPIQVFESDISDLFLARIITFILIIFLLIFIRTKHVLSYKEAIILLFIYLIYISYIIFNNLS